MNFDRAVARLIDHTILKPEAVRDEVKTVCAEALRYEFASVCVNAFWVPFVEAELRVSPVKVCTVVGFPLGATSTTAKVIEAQEALTAGAEEIDMVINVGALRGGEGHYGQRFRPGPRRTFHSRGEGTGATGASQHRARLRAGTGWRGTLLLLHEDSKGSHAPCDPGRHSRGGTGHGETIHF